MKNHFFYTIEEEVESKVEGPDGKKTKVKKTRQASFDVTKAYLTFEHEPNKLVVQLLDHHQESGVMEIPLSNKSGDHTGGYRSEVGLMVKYTQIILNEEDSKRFRELFEIK